MKHILIVDDEYGSRESLRLIFSKSHMVSLADSADAAAAILAEKPVDLVLLDVVMPEKNGIALLKDVHATYPDMPVIMVSASTSIPPVVEAIRAGAHDYVTKPFDVDNIRHIVQRALENTTLHRQVEILQTEVAREFPVHDIVGQSPAFRASLDEIRKAAVTDATVLLYGESGTGKELAARLLHSLSPRRTEPFVAVHCAALPEALMESELFGYEKGAFTHAEKRKPGRFDLAGSGTMFFDEVGEMSLAVQVKLLRVLQEREFMRVGGTRIIRTNARIVAATARDLRKEVEAKRFRDDLYYRLNVIPVRLPPLRDRREDIPLLVQYFLGQFRQALDLPEAAFAPEALELLSAYSWPGNVRELRNVLERVLVLHGRERTIGTGCLPEEFLGGHADAAFPPAGDSLENAVTEYERRIITDALRKAGGIQTKAAGILGTTRRILKYRMEKLALMADDYRA